MHFWNLNNCYDFNKGISNYANATNTLMSMYYMCPDYDGIDSNACKYAIPTRTTYIPKVTIQFSDIVIVMTIGGSKRDRDFVRHWWLDLIPKNVSLNIVLIADSCDRTNDWLNNTCPTTDPANIFRNDLYEKHIENDHNITIIRVQGISDVGYFRLACKVLTGFQIIYELYPTKKYYFKIDDDAIVFPKRLLNFLNTLHTVAEPEKPLYFGNIMNDHKHFLLCNDFSLNETNNGTVHKAPDIENMTGICYAQGGAYGLNNYALRNFQNTVLCTPDMDCEVSGEDAYVGFKIYRESRRFVIQCEGFQSQQERNLYDRLRTSITLHHVNNVFLKNHNEILNELKMTEINNSISTTK